MHCGSSHHNTHAPFASPVSVLEGISSAFAGPSTQLDCTFMQNVDYYQPGQTGVASANATDCCARCSWDPECQFFTWYDGLCYKKTDNAGRTASQGRVSGACTTQKPAVSYVTASQPASQLVAAHTLTTTCTHVFSPSATRQAALLCYALTRLALVMLLPRLPRPTPLWL